MDKTRRSLHGALVDLTKAVDQEPSVPALIDAYASFRSKAAADFQLLAMQQIPELKLLSATTAAVEDRMRALFGTRVAPKYLRVKRYIRTNAVLLEYLAMNVSQTISSGRLRVLTSDQVHTERRVRELRDLGFRLDEHQDGQDVTYRLESLEPDLDFAARFQLEHRLIEDSLINAKARMLLLLKAELHRPVHTTRLARLSGGQGHYDKRLRELREIYNISTGLNRPDISPSDYVLESLDEKEPHDQFKSKDRDAMLKRDRFTCQDCRWSREDRQTQGRRYLEVHHKNPRAQGGKSEIDNGITLCNVCHDGRHAALAAAKPKRSRV